MWRATEDADTSRSSGDGPPDVGITAIRLRRPPLQEAIKRSLDVVLAGIVLAIVSPLFAAIAVLVVVDSPGPVFYRAERVGFRGRRLRMLKFRKMHAAARGPDLTLAGDERLTRVGAWLARTKLDELPQLLHVLRGDMSLVGPRPEAPGFVARYPAEYSVILSTRPGLTGYTQLAFAREGSILDPKDAYGHYVRALLPQKVELDQLYATNRSIRRDLQILVATFRTVILQEPVAVNRRTGELTLRRR